MRDMIQILAEQDESRDIQNTKLETDRLTFSAEVDMIRSRTSRNAAKA
jgi:hypothetical protein